ncbi:MAG: sugar-binding transcriptional regulator [Candidatus Atribacteria bacterium]|nr:sugar-binding transcriptional regulator [Candidatus Atribacteria bacterium]
MTQSEIAHLLQLSQPKVARLIDKAQKSGIVKISIESPISNCLRIESEFKHRFALQDVVVIPTTGETELYTSVGRAGAWYLEKVLKDGDLVGIAWGRTLKQLALSIRPTRVKNLKFVTLVGGLTSSASLNPYNIGEKLASIFNGECYYLYAPAVVESEEVRNFYLNEKINQKTLCLARQARWSLVGMGTVDVRYSIYSLTGFIEYHELEALKQKGAVGDILGQFYTINGTILDTPLHRRTVALPLEDIRQMSNVMGVAGGIEKSEAILGALRGRFINILITDEKTALQILYLDKNQEG